MRVERQRADGKWELHAADGDVETRISAEPAAKHKLVSVSWFVPASAATGSYRIRHMGASWHEPTLHLPLTCHGHPVPYQGSSSPFNVIARPNSWLDE